MKAPWLKEKGDRHVCVVRARGRRSGMDDPVRFESTSMTIRPLHDRIVVQRIDEGEQRVGGIIIPDSAKEKPQQGKVIAAGDGKSKEDGKRVPLDVKPGDSILFGTYSGQEIKLDGDEYLIMREDDVLAVIEEGDIKKKMTKTKK